MFGIHFNARLRNFARQQDGAITVDWIVLTAAAVFLGLAGAFVVAASVPRVADGISGYVGGVDPGEPPSDTNPTPNNVSTSGG